MISPSKLAHRNRREQGRRWKTTPTTGQELVQEWGIGSDGRLGIGWRWNGTGRDSDTAEASRESMRSDFNEEAEERTIRLGTVPRLQLLSQTVLATEEAAEIRRLIAELTKIENPDFGLSSTLNGVAFLPIEGMQDSSSMLLTNHQIDSSSALKRLVELGPKALPYLLESLDDQTPTKLQIEHEGCFGIMRFANELRGNPANTAEAEILPKFSYENRHPMKHIDKYSVNLGDVCFVAIGQIVGRRYQAVRYQPTACIVINSPTHDPELCQQVRGIWTSDAPHRKLFESLLLDYVTEAECEPGNQWWSFTNRLTNQAALRLLFYFPREASELIAEKLDRLAVADIGLRPGMPPSEAQLDASRKRDVANGLYAPEFVRAVGWCQEPIITQAVYRVFQRATDVNVLLSTVPSVWAEHHDEVQERLIRLLAQLGIAEIGPFGYAFHTLVELGKSGTTDCKTAFQHFLSHNTVHCCLTMCYALREVRGEWAVELLETLLSDRRKADGLEYNVSTKRRLPIRICDEAADSIARNDHHLRFAFKGTHKNLDRQIQMMQRQIARKQSEGGQGS